MAARKAKKAEALPVDPVVHEGTLVERPRKDATTRKREQMEALVGMRNELLGRSLRIIDDTMAFRDIDTTLERDLDPAYEKMVRELGEEEAQKTYRLALMGWQKAADAPTGVKVAVNIAVGIMKANAAEKGGTHVLNVGKILIDSSAVPQFEERDVE